MSDRSAESAFSLLEGLESALSDMATQASDLESLASETQDGIQVCKEKVVGLSQHLEKQKENEASQDDILYAHKLLQQAAALLSNLINKPPLF